MTTRALVLGGGGSLGNAWEIGVVAGLYAGGVDVRAADLIVGTSAGATAAAQITSEAPDVLLAQALAEQYPSRPAAPPAGAGGGSDAPRVNYVQLTGDIITSSTDPVDMRRRLGAAALAADGAASADAIAARLAQVASRLPSQEWPAQRVVLTAVDAVTGDELLYDRESGVSLADAVTASTSMGFGGPAHAIDGRRLLDGGYRANENADLAAGHDRVLVLSPFGGRSRHPEEWGTRLAAHVQKLSAEGSDVRAIFPDDASEEVFGGNMMNLSQRPAAAQAGCDQGRRISGVLADLWH
ncbi:patatin-like phospholipase family protein [Demequina capsici]|uniref:Patatin-like phospholipase family protein n=1 Tax=Demequina capsici TaxID=3075620 RepID=A0AA96FB59_9MICO|nr:patatin-like phospholipase family protein [Demequina sp. PMTSA13]WNM26468.1 patatin-like phospholipase family protein [Demequina sp. PMTSA13]